MRFPRLSGWIWLWARFCMEAPQRQRRPVQRYSDATNNAAVAGASPQLLRHVGSTVEDAAVRAHIVCRGCRVLERCRGRLLEDDVAKLRQQFYTPGVAGGNAHIPDQSDSGCLLPIMLEVTCSVHIGSTAAGAATSAHRRYVFRSSHSPSGQEALYSSREALHLSR